MTFSGLSPLVVDEVSVEGELVRARTPDRPGGMSGLASRVHGYHQRKVLDLSVDQRRVVVVVRVQRMVCPTRGCRQTFREQLPRVLDRYQRRTSRLAAQVGAVVRELAAGVDLVISESPSVRILSIPD